MNVFYISYIYKPATSSHTKPGLFETTSLTWLLTDSWISPFRKSSCAATSELDPQQIPEFRRLPILWFCRFMTSGLHKFATSEPRRFEIPDLRKFVTSELRRFEIPDLRKFATSELQNSRSSQVRDSWKLISRISYNSTFRGWQVFLNSPTLAPWGSGLTPTIRFHKNLRISVKKCHPRNVEVDTRPPEISQRSNRELPL
jgi:hypothetical protein